MADTRPRCDQLYGVEHAYTLVEQARPRCEQFRDGGGTVDERVALEQIHQELGMAGWVISSTSHPARRRPRLAAAHRQPTTPALYPAQSHALAAIVIEAEAEAEDAAVAVPLREPATDHAHQAHLHLHLLYAMELLASLL